MAVASSCVFCFLPRDNAGDRRTLSLVVTSRGGGKRWEGAGLRASAFGGPAGTSTARGVNDYSYGGMDAGERIGCGSAPGA